MKSHIITAVFGLIVTVCATGCRPTAAQNESATPAKEQFVKAPVTFNRDSAYSYVRRQVSFGPRVSGSQANRDCRYFLVSELKRHGGEYVNVQHGDVTAFTGETLPIGNIMASFNPDLNDRVLLIAHYDTRPWSDCDHNEENRMKPVVGANDGASGVAVILEIVRNLGLHKAPVGVDVLFVDAEDYGQASGFSTHDSSWCLGTQYWVEHMPYTPDNMPRYGVLFDMVGGVGARFHREYFSDHYARALVDKVWSVAERSGFDSRFINKGGGSVVDDHIFLNEAGIPTVDIIESKNATTGTFPPTWHTTEDTIDNIDPASLEAVGQTVLNLIYSETPSEKGS